jgi:hypothetical protein
MSTADATPRDEPLARIDSAEIPSASLLPALDPTPMGWKHRDWMFGIDQRAVFDQAGNRPHRMVGRRDPRGLGDDGRGRAAHPDPG